MSLLHVHLPFPQFAPAPQSVLYTRATCFARVGALLVRRVALQGPVALTPLRPLLLPHHASNSMRRQLDSRPDRSLFHAHNSLPCFVGSLCCWSTVDTWVCFDTATLAAFFTTATHSFTSAYIIGISSYN